MPSVTAAEVRCPACERGFLAGWERSNEARCVECSSSYPVQDAVIDLLPNESMQRSLAQRSMEAEPIVRIYESRLWRRGPHIALILGISFEGEMRLILRAAEYAKGTSAAPAINSSEAEAWSADMLGHFERDGKENAYAIQHDLQETMHNLVGIIRTGSELKEALEEVRAQKERAKHTGVEGNRQYNPGWHLAMDLRSLLTVSEAITLAALERKESRGAHTRDDYPLASAEFAKNNVVVRMGPDSEVRISLEPLREMPAELRELVEGEVKVGA